MNQDFVLLLDTVGSWLPALTWLLGQLAVTGPGRQVEQTIKERVKILEDPEAERAFRNAFKDGITQYERRHGTSPAAQAVAQVLTHAANHDTSGLDRQDILHQIFAVRPNSDTLAPVIKRHPGPRFVRCKGQAALDAASGGMCSSASGTISGTSSCR